MAMSVSACLVVLFSTVYSIAAIQLHPTIVSPTSDIVIDSEKAIMIQRVGTYASQLEKEIVHSIIPLNIACDKSLSKDVCAFISKAIYPNMAKICTILPSRDTISPLPRYEKNEVSNLITDDISKVLRINRPDTLISKQNSIVHLINDRLHTSSHVQRSLQQSATADIDRERSNIVQISPPPATIVLQQMASNTIAFDFLTDAELKLFLTAVIPTIDKSYELNDLSQSLKLFSELIIAQSVHILRSCSDNAEHTSSGHPCLIVSTLFVRPLIANNNAFSVYRLTPLPAIVRDEQFVYSNIPVVIAIDSKDQSTILWDTLPNENECLFSIFTYCRKELPAIQLHNIPCLSELLNANTHAVSSCEIKRSRHIQNELVNIGNDVWLLSPRSEPIYCHLQQENGVYNGLTPIKETSIMRLPCGKTMTCSDIKLSSSVCTNQNVLINSLSDKAYESLSNIPRPLKKMNERLVSVFQLTLRNSMKKIVDDLKDNRMTLTTFIKEFGVIALSAMFVGLLSLILFFIKWIKYSVQKRMGALERDLDDLIHAYV